VLVASAAPAEALVLLEKAIHMTRKLGLLWLLLAHQPVHIQVPLAGATWR
jgi:hypothetical protein